MGPWSPRELVWGHPQAKSGPAFSTLYMPPRRFVPHRLDVVDILGRSRLHVSETQQLSWPTPHPYVICVKLLGERGQLSTNDRPTCKTSQQHNR